MMLNSFSSSTAASSKFTVIFYREAGKFWFYMPMFIEPKGSAP